MNIYLPQDKDLRKSSIATLVAAQSHFYQSYCYTQNLLYGLRGSTPYVYAYTVNNFLFVYLKSQEFNQY